MIGSTARAKLAVVLTCTILAATIGAGTAGGDAPSMPAPLCTAATTVGFAPTNYVSNASISDDGLRVAHRSDPQADGLAPRQVSYFDVISATTTQVTAATTGVSVDISIAGDGSRIAFESTADLIGANPDGRSQIFLHDTATGVTTQATHATGGRSARPALSADGSVVAFDSDSDLVSENPDGNRQIFLFDAGASPTTTQLTNTVSGTDYRVSISADGTRIAFGSNGDHVGTNPDGNYEVFLIDTVAETTTQLTNDSTDHSFDPSISADGTRIAFISDANLTGENPSGDYEIYLFDTSDSMLTRITPSAGSIDGSFEPSISADGTRIAYSSDGDYTGHNPTNAFQIYLYDVLTETTTQVSHVPPDGFAAKPSTSGDGTLIVFDARRDPGAIATNTSEIVLASCGASMPSFTDVAGTHPFFAEIEWLAAARVTSGFTDGTYRPGDAVSRQAMAAFMYRLAGSPAFDAPTTASFTDVTETHPFFAEIEWLADAGISTGFADGTFQPTASVSRQAMAAFMYRLAGSPAFDAPTTASFTDVAETHPFFAEVEWLADAGISTGFADGTYRPGDAVSRQAMAAFMYRLVSGPGVSP